jgi:hypothetical protein
MEEWSNGRLEEWEGWEGWSDAGSEYGNTGVLRLKDWALQIVYGLLNPLGFVRRSV